MHPQETKQGMSFFIAAGFYQLKNLGGPSFLSSKIHTFNIQRKQEESMAIKHMQALQMGSEK
jgi:hypothetical protein